MNSAKQLYFPDNFLLNNKKIKYTYLDKAINCS